MMANTNCCVPNCHSRKSKNPDLSFHSFPKEINKREVWKNVLKIAKPVSNSVKVCSRHFTRRDFHFIGETTKRPRLKIGVVPNKNLPLSSVEDPIKVETENILAQEQDEQCNEIKSDYSSSSSMDKTMDHQQKKVSVSQKEIIISTMESNPDLYQERITAMKRRNDWMKLAKRLNAEGGCKKTVGQWQKCWTDIKEEVKKKYRQQRNKTGRPFLKAFTDLDDRVKSLLGPDLLDDVSVEGHCLSPPRENNDDDEEAIDPSSPSSSLDESPEMEGSSQVRGVTLEKLVNMTEDSAADLRSIAASLKEQTALLKDIEIKKIEFEEWRLELDERRLLVEQQKADALSSIANSVALIVNM